MKKIYYLPMALLVAATSCNNTKPQTAKPEHVGLNVANLDTTANPGASFYQYATGGWQKANPLTDEHARFGTFDQLAENNNKQIKELILSLGDSTQASGSLGQKIGDLYKIGMDSVKLNKDGAAPLKDQLATIAAVKTKDDVIRLAGELRQYASSPFFSVYIAADEKSSSVNIVTLSQGGLGMGDRDYYVNPDNAKMREGYKDLIQKQFVNAGYSDADSKKAAENVMNVETSLAQSHFTKEAARVPEKNYHKMTVADLNKVAGSFNWKEFFDASRIKGFTNVDLKQIEAIKGATNIIEKTPVPVLKDYLSWCLINSAASYLSDNFVVANFDFYGKQMQGTKIQRPRWRRTVSVVNNSLGEAVGQMYVDKYFPPASKARMLKLVHNLQSSLAERISGLEWMSEPTKVKAHEKLNAYIIKIGYPDKWRDYTSLEIKNDSYWANDVRSSIFEYNYMLDKLNKPVDKMEWDMTPQTVNAYYNPTTNEICFPAGILQPPFFYPNADDATNYGAIGVVIGHEMSHGFDDQGRKYDKDGNMSDWWTAEDAKNFELRANKLADHFSSILVTDTLHANGKYTLGENIADHGGLHISFNAFMKTEQAKENKKIDGFTPEQRFYLAYANVWAGNIRTAEIIRRTKLDPHALGKWRVDGALPEIDDWYSAFNINDKDSLFIPKDKRVSIW